MDDAEFVRGVERVGDLLRDRQGFVQRQAIGAGRQAMGRGDPSRQVVALDQLHHEGGDALALFESIDGGDIGMVQRGKGLGFARESRQTLGVVGKRVRQDLDCDVAIELRVTRPIDLAHASAPEQIGQLEDAETGAGSQGQTVAV